MIHLHQVMKSLTNAFLKALFTKPVTADSNIQAYQLARLSSVVTAPQYHVVPNQSSVQTV